MEQSQAANKDAARSLADLEPLAIEALEDLLTQNRSQRVRLKAAQFVLERGSGESQHAAVLAILELDRSGPTGANPLG